MKLLIFTILLTALLAPSASTALNAKTPNILFIITDQHHANMLSSAGNPYLKTKALELAAEELRSAQSALSEVTGEITSDDLLGEIFSSFCIGK